jgi:hypothetical protein
MPFVTLSRGLAKSEQPVLEQEQTLDLGVALVGRCGELGQVESCHDVRHHGEPAAINLSCDGLRLGLIDDGENRVRVRMIDELVGQKSVQQGLDRRVGRTRVD